MGLQDQLGDSREDVERAPAEMPTRGMVVGGRYHLGPPLATGPHAHTVRAVDLQTQAEVVVKLVRRGGVTPMAEALLRHEAEVLAKLDSSTVLPILDFGRDERVIYLVSPLLDGVTLEDRLTRGPLSTREVVAVGQDVATALAAANELGILHRDVKPSNVMVRSDRLGVAPGEEHRIGSAVLIDFGFSWSMRLGGTPADLAVGTVRYLSPEAAGLLDVEVDARADLYSLGVVLFEALAGHPPFDAPTVGEVLRQHLNAEVPSLRRSGARIPRALDEVVTRLLAKDAADRYQSAHAVLTDLQAIAAGLDAGDDDPTVVIGLDERRQTLAAPTFVGRRQELDSLLQALYDVGAGGSALVVLDAPSGGGKSRLLAEFSREATASGAWLLSGQGLDQAAPRPFQLLTGIASGILSATANDTGALEDHLSGLVGDHAQAVVDALPALGELFRSTVTTLGPADHGEIRSVRGLARLLDSLGGTGRPAVVILDDCQWADDLTVKVLQEWQSSRDHRTTGIMLVVAFRSEEVANNHRLRQLAPDHHLSLAAFDAHDLRALAESMAGPLPAAALDIIVRVSQGSPFMAAAVLRGMVEEGALHPGEDRWLVDPEAMKELRSSAHAAAFLARRIGLLPAAPLAILQLGAVLGKEFDVELAASLAGLELGILLAQLEEPKRRHIVWIDHQAGTVRFTHDKLRETILGQIRESVRDDLHRRAGERLEAEHPSRVFEIAYHLDAAGQPQRALPYALVAADQARAQHSLDVAREQYEIARRGSDQSDATAEHAIALGLGDLAMLTGRYAEAEAEFIRARQFTDDGVEQATISGRLGELAFKRGDSDGAAEELESALRSLGRHVPKTLPAQLAVALWQVLVQVVHTLLPRLVVGRRRLDDPRAANDLLAARLLSRLAHSYWFTRGSIPTAAAHLREMNIAERYPPTPELAQAWSEHSPVMTLITWFSRGVRYVERSLELRRQFGDVWGQGQSLHFYGIVLYGSSRYVECIERCREAVRLLERTGDQWEVNTARWHIAYSEYRLGELRAAVEVARQVHRSGVEIGDAQARGISLSAWSKAAGGDVPQDLLAPELAGVGGDVHTGAEVLQAEAIRLLHAGRPAEAVALLRRARGIVLRAVAMQEYVAPVIPWLATALREQAEATDSSAHAQRRALQRQARRSARIALLLARRYRNNLPHAAREVALLAAMSGRTRAARRWFATSLEVARSQGASAEEMLTLDARARVGQALGWPETEGDLAAAMTMHRRIDPSASPFGSGHGDVTASVVDRFENLMEVGRQLASSITVDAIHLAVHDAALTLLRGDQCVVLDLVDGAPRVVHGDRRALISEHAVFSVLESKKPMVFGGLARTDTTASMHLAGVRSGLCIPILVRGAVMKCVLVSSNSLRGLYGPEEIRLAEFIAAIAGAAIENAQGWADVQDFTKSLEGKVAERTAELDVRAAAERGAREDAERRARLLAGLAAAGRKMSTLDPVEVLKNVVRTARYLGFEGAEVCVLSEDRRTYRVAHDIGLPESYNRKAQSAEIGLVGRVLRSEATIVVDYRTLKDAAMPILEAGFRASVATPILSPAGVVGVLVAGTRSEESPRADLVEALELLAAQAGRALENATAYEDERRNAERLAELDQLKDDFLSTASHELRTPLAVISGMGLTLEQRWDELLAADRAREFVSRINANAAALTDIITTLLDFSTLQRGALEIHPQRMAISGALTDLADRLATLFAAHELVVNVQPQLLVHGDGALLMRAVENLLGNAVKYTARGTRIELRASRVDDQVEVAVEDQGAGIAQEDVVRLTERFFRVSRSTGAGPRGLGLGLAFTQDILVLHGSELSVKSTPGTGSCFSFRLPVATSDDAGAPSLLP